MTTEIISFVTAISHATNVFKSAVQARDDAKRLEALAEINSNLAELASRYASVAQEQLTLLKQNEALKKQIEAHDKWEQEKVCYSLSQIPSGGFVYILKPAKTANDASHWLCTNCYENRHKSILQLHLPSGGESYWVCPKCQCRVESRGEWPKPSA